MMVLVVLGVDAVMKKKFPKEATRVMLCDERHEHRRAINNGLALNGRSDLYGMRDELTLS